MTVPFIFMTIALVIMLIVANIQNHTIKRLTEELEEINEKRRREVYGLGKVYDTHRRFIVIDNAGDNETLNRTVERYKADGYEFDSIKSTDRLLVFVKRIEVNEG